MNILVTGARGFVGKNLVATLKNIRDGKDNTRPALKIDEIYEYSRSKGAAALEEYCKKADFVFNFAGVNRPQDSEEYVDGNFGFAVELLSCLKAQGNKCPVMLSSSIQASLIGRYNNSEYGNSKLFGEQLFFDYAEDTGAQVLVYRFPNLFGKWCRPNYNSVIATFCHNIANGLPIRVDDPSTELELLYIDDLVYEMLDALEDRPHHCDYQALKPIFRPDGAYCAVPTSYKSNLGEIVELLGSFKSQPRTLLMPSIPEGSFAKKLYSTYLSYLPENAVCFSLPMESSENGSLTQLMKTADHGQLSVDISRPGATKGNVWHRSKWEFLIVVSGRGLIQQRKIGSDEIMEFEVSGDKIQAVHMLPGYTHDITNISQTENLVTVIWSNENYDPENPDTYFEKVLD